MVYISSLNALVVVGLIILISSFIIIVGYFGFDKLQSSVETSIKEELESSVCRCVDIISDNNTELVIMNVNCLYVENLTLYAGDEVHKVNKTIYYEDVAVISYYYQPSFFTFTYNNCVEIFDN